MPDLKDYLETNMMLVFFRLTHDIEYNTLFKDISSYKMCHKFILAKELSEKEVTHYHVLMLTTDDNQKNAQQNFKNYMTRIYPIEGNKNFAFTKTEKGTKTRIASYCVKDGEFKSKGFTEDELNLFKKLSYKKFDGKKILERFEDLKEEYLKTDFSNTSNSMIKELEFLYQKMADIKKDYNQQYTSQTLRPKVNLYYTIKHGNGFFASESAANHKF